MKIWSRAMLVLALVALMGGTLVACGGGSSTSSPENTVKSYLNAAQSKDYCSASMKLMTKNMNYGDIDETINICEESMNEIKYIRVSNLEIDVEDISGDEATVTAMFDSEIKYKDSDEPKESEETLTFYLVKENGKWLIDDIEVTQYQDSAGEFKTDNEVVRLATAVFYSDVHSGWKDMNGDDNPNDATSFDDNVWGRSGGDTVRGHYYPTAIALASKHVLNLSTTRFDTMNPANPLVLGSGDIAATDAQIQSHAIWMGLLVHDDQGTYTSLDGTTDRWQVSVISGETGLYLQEMPNSAMTYNGDTHTGTSGRYCWVVGENAQVYGVYKASDGYWYSGFNGAYP
jgi:hypothetical protein